MQDYRLLRRVLSIVLAFFCGVAVTSCSMRKYAAEALRTSEKQQEAEPEIIVMYCDVETTVGLLETEEIITEPETTKEPISLGMFKVTAYCDCSDCCDKDDGITATGTQATEGRTIAVDPSVIPFGTQVIINGHTYIAEDCGAAIKGNRIDMFFHNHSDARVWGVKNLEIFVEG